MRLNQPRIPPLSDSEMNPTQRAVLQPHFERNTVFNIFRTLAHAPEAYRSFSEWGRYILSDQNSLPPRQREIIILRTGFNCKSGYEWAQHVRIGKMCGLSDQEIDQIKAGPTHLDELTNDSFIKEETWQALSTLTQKQQMDLVFTCGQYTQVCMMLNSFGVQLDAGLELDKDLKV